LGFFNKFSSVNYTLARQQSWAAHWAAEMDHAFAFRRDVDRRKAAHHARTKHRLERRRTVRRQDAAIRVVMAAIDAAGAVGNSDGAALL
jgi:hypothetical protein